MGGIRIGRIAGFPVSVNWCVLVILLWLFTCFWPPVARRRAGLLEGIHVAGAGTRCHTPGAITGPARRERIVRRTTEQWVGCSLGAWCDVLRANVFGRSGVIVQLCWCAKYCICICIACFAQSVTFHELPNVLRVTVSARTGVPGLTAPTSRCTGRGALSPQRVRTRKSLCRQASWCGRARSIPCPRCSL
jgi:hypothetical protein